MATLKASAKSQNYAFNYLLMRNYTFPKYVFLQSINRYCVCLNIRKGLQKNKEKR